MRWRSMNSTAGVSALSGVTWWRSQTFSNIVCGARDIEYSVTPLAGRDRAASEGTPSGGDGARLRGRHIDMIEPAPLVGRLAREQTEEGVLQGLRDRSPLAGPDGNPVHRADRRDFHRGAGEERFVREIKHLARDRAFAHLD